MECIIFWELYFSIVAVEFVAAGGKLPPHFFAAEVHVKKAEKNADFSGKK